MFRRRRFYIEANPEHDGNILNVFKRKPSTKKTSFKKFCSDLLQQSSVTGVSQIVNSKGWIRKLIKLLILSFGVAGFFLQTHEFLKLYWEFSTVTSVKKLSSMKKPAITICDKNLVSRRHFCETFPDDCTTYNDSLVTKAILCMKYPSYCQDPNNVYYMYVHESVVRSFVEKIYKISLTKTLGFKIEEKILLCEWISKESSENQSNIDVSSSCGDPVFVRGMTDTKLPGACYTLKPKPSVIEEELGPDSVLRLILKWDTPDLVSMISSFWDSQRRYYYVDFHHPGHLSNPFKEGGIITQQQSYKVKLTQLDNIRLPPPYSTKCYDYATQWKKNKFTGPVVRKDCEGICEIHATVEAFGCVPRSVNYPHEKELCTKYKSFDHSLNAKIQKCIEECKDACSDTEFYKVFEKTGEIDAATGLKKYDSPTVVILEVIFDSLKSEKIVHKPKYESIELFSYLGGYLGMWLGWSLVAIFDFVEILFNICKYPFGGKKKGNRKSPVGHFVLQPVYRRKRLEGRC